MSQHKVHRSCWLFYFFFRPSAVLNDHHGDRIVALNCKVLPGDNTALVSAQPARFYFPDYLASKGWVGLRLDTGKIDWTEVRKLVRGSYQLIAPKRLVALLDDRGSA